MNEEIRYKLLKMLENNPDISQRELSQELGVSLGKVNYCLKALIDRGLVKVENFKTSPNKRAYAYFLTPKGIDEKAKVVMRFLKIKNEEYKKIQQELYELRKEVSRVTIDK